MTALVATRSFPTGLKDGEKISINGKVQAPAKGFGVNLRCDQNSIALHFNPRFNEQVIICNTMENGHWGAEERNTNMPFQPGDSFSMVIAVTARSYEITIHLKKIMSYKHRLPLHTVRTLEISGDVIVDNISC